MSYNPNTWQERTGTGLNKFTDQNGVTYEFTSTPDEVTQVGTPFSTGWMNHIEQGIGTVDGYFDNAILGTVHGGTGASTLAAGDYLVGNGSSAVQTKTPAQVLSDIGAQPAFSLLWSGSAATGNAITVPGIANYSIFMVEFTYSEAWAGIGFGKALSTTIFEASAVFPASTQGPMLTNNLYGTMSGNILTITSVNGFVHNPSGSHSAVLASTITKIWGIL